MRQLGRSKRAARRSDSPRPQRERPRSPQFSSRPVASETLGTTYLLKLAVTTGPTRESGSLYSMMNAAALHGHRIPRNLRLMIFSFHILKCKTRQYYASAARPAGAQYVLNQPWLVLPVQEIATKCQELVQSSSSLPVSSDLLRLLIRTQQLLRPAVSDHAAASGLWASSVAAAAMCPCVSNQHCHWSLRPSACVARNGFFQTPYCNLGKF